MWAKNLLFFGVCTAGLLALAATVAPSIDSASRPRVAVQTDSVRAAAARVDAAFDQLWQQSRIEPAPPAPELIVARRMSLALEGTIPSLEEVRHFESLPAGQRLDIWLAELLADRRSADYVAERLAPITGHLPAKRSIALGPCCSAARWSSRSTTWPPRARFPRRSSCRPTISSRTASISGDWWK